MTDLPYTDADLRHEAARQHHGYTRDRAFDNVGEHMTGAVIHSRQGEPRACWHDLDDIATDGNPDPFDTAQAAIYALIRGAADTSAWAVNLGADGLQPTGHLIEIDGPDGQIAVRMHFAFDPTMPGGLRDEVIDDITRVLAPVIPLRPQR